MTIIVFSYNIPRPDRSSGERRLVSILEILAKTHHVDFCVSRFQVIFQSEEYQKYIPLLSAKGIHVLPIREGIVRDALRQQKYDVGFFEMFWIAEETVLDFWKYQPEAVTIVDSVDVHFAREAIQATLGQISEKQVNDTRARELRIYRQADLTIAASQDDAALLTEQYGIKNVSYIPNVLASVPRKSHERQPVAIFVGSFLWSPNVDGMRWFTESIWPSIYEKNNRARFQIVGHSPTQEIIAMGDLPGVEVLGFVPDTGPFLDQASVSVAPLRFGGGMKGKVTEALAYGLPVVSTSVGAQGLQAKNGVDMIVTDDAEEFAHAVLELFDQPALQAQIGSAGQMLNASHCSPEAVEGRLRDMMAAVEALPVSGRNRSAALKRFAWKLGADVRKIRGGLYVKPGPRRLTRHPARTVLRTVARLVPSSVSRLVPKAMKKKIWQ
jgi:glycosyltransferase involved in cell wall biosynthesis